MDGDDGVSDIRDLLTICGYTTLQSISQIRKKDYLEIQIELNRQKKMSEFVVNYPNLVDFTIGPGTSVVLGDIVKAAHKILLKPVSMDFDPIKVREKVLNDIRHKVYLIFVKNFHFVQKIFRLF